MFAYGFDLGQKKKIQVSSLTNTLIKLERAWENEMF